MVWSTHEKPLDTMSNAELYGHSFPKEAEPRGERHRERMAVLLSIAAPEKGWLHSSALLIISNGFSGVVSPLFSGCFGAVIYTVVKRVCLDLPDLDHALRIQRKLAAAICGWVAALVSHWCCDRAVL